MRFVGDDMLGRDAGSCYTTKSPRQIILQCLELEAVAFIVLSNHLTANAQPALEDIQVTEELAMAANSFSIAAVDHIIVTRDELFSFLLGGLSGIIAGHNIAGGSSKTVIH